MDDPRDIEVGAKLSVYGLLGSGYQVKCGFIERMANGQWAAVNTERREWVRMQGFSTARDATIAARGNRGVPATQAVRPSPEG